MIMIRTEQKPFGTSILRRFKMVSASANLKLCGGAPGTILKIVNHLIFVFLSIGLNILKKFNMLSLDKNRSIDRPANLASRMQGL